LKFAIVILEVAFLVIGGLIDKLDVLIVEIEVEIAVYFFAARQPIGRAVWQDEVAMLK